MQRYRNFAKATTFYIYNFVFPKEIAIFAADKINVSWYCSNKDKMKIIDDFYQEANNYLINENEIISFYSNSEIQESWDNIYDFVSSLGYVIAIQISFAKRRKSLRYIRLRSLSLIINDITKPIKNDLEKKSTDEVIDYIKSHFSSLYSVYRTKLIVQDYFPIENVNEEGLIIK